ncbi:hypothetical protein V1264_021573 [Littorina saxatilis]|uniref:Uncharacterized protein n=1 Tax=Littorina saxatilis TaxID=31220 RepID=A0AAN9AIL8_9CAEN
MKPILEAAGLVLKTIHDLSLDRRNRILNSQSLNRKYKKLASSEIPITKNLFGDDLKGAFAQMDTTSELGQSFTVSSKGNTFFPTRAKNYQDQWYENNSHQNFRKGPCQTWRGRGKTCSAWPRKVHAQDGARHGLDSPESSTSTSECHPESPCKDRTGPDNRSGCTSSLDDCGVVSTVLTSAHRSSGAAASGEKCPESGTCLNSASTSQKTSTDSRNVIWDAVQARGIQEKQLVQSYVHHGVQPPRNSVNPTYAGGKCDTIYLHV